MSLALLLLSVLPPALCAAVFLRPPFPEMFGRQAWMPGVLCAAWTLGLVVVALLLPDALWLTALVGTVLGAFLARGRLAARFARQPLPPGSMSFAGGVRGLADRSFYTAGFAKWGPIFKTTQFGAPILCVGGMERIARLLHEHAADLGRDLLAALAVHVGHDHLAAAGGQQPRRAFAQARSRTGDDEDLACDVHGAKKKVRVEMRSGRAGVRRPARRARGR